MKKKKQGFTLVELLAVIVILAVIAVIAIPQIIKIVEQSKKDAFKESVKSAIKSAETEAVNGKTGGLLKDLNLNNNPFTDGGWGLVDNKVVIFSAMTSTYTTGEVIEVSSLETITIKKTDATDTYKTLASRFDTVKNATTGYLTGTQTNNYIKLKIDGVYTEFRVVRINNDGSVLIVSSAPIDTNYITDGVQNMAYKADGISNNFANSDIKLFLNTSFYNKITNKSNLKKNIYDTRLAANDCVTLSGTPESIEEYVVLLTLEDACNAGACATGGSYLRNGTSWWLGTGSSDNLSMVWGIPATLQWPAKAVSITATDVTVRPVIVLQSGITTTGGTGILNDPYTIE